MTRFSSDILLPFPNSNDLNSRVEDVKDITSVIGEGTAVMAGNDTF